MKKCILFFGLFTAIYAQAQVCSLGGEADSAPPTPTFSVLVQGQPTLTVLESRRLNREEAMTVHRLLEGMVADRSKNEAEAQRFLQEHRDLSGEVGSQALFLQTMLEDRDVTEVYVDYAPDRLKDWEKYASFVYLSQYSDFRVAPDPTIDSLFVLLAGAPLSVKIKNPELTAKLKFDDFPDRVEAAPGNGSELQKRADRKLDELKSELKKNRRTHEKLLRVAREIRKGNYDRESDSRVEDKVLPRFWKSARPKIREWLKLELAARHHRGSANPLAGFMKPGEFTIAFVQPEHFEILKKAFQSTCSKH